jgi:hypothetical protein
LKTSGLDFTERYQHITLQRRGTGQNQTDKRFIQYLTDDLGASD